MNSTKTILAVIAGASLGAIAGILLAPDSGAATRKKVIDKSTDFKDLVKENIMGFLDRLEKSVDTEVLKEKDAVAKMNTDSSASI